MQLSEVNNTFQHKITSGGEYLWDCYPSPWTIDYTSKYAHGTVIFDTVTQRVYEVNVSPKADADGATEPKPYRYIEAKDRNVDPNEAWDDVKWVDLETEEDFLNKAYKMFDGESFDTRVEVPIDLDNDTMLKLCLEAHKRDITLNEMVEILLREAIAEYDRNRT
jgi:hypothetical protein